MKFFYYFQYARDIQSLFFLCMYWHLRNNCRWQMWNSFHLLSINTCKAIFNICFVDKTTKTRFFLYHQDIISFGFFLLRFENDEVNKTVICQFKEEVIEMTSELLEGYTWAYPWTFVILQEINTQLITLENVSYIFYNTNTLVSNSKIAFDQKNKHSFPFNMSNYLVFFLF